MEESLGAQYAIQIAVHTLRDRCKSLQQRIALLEEENVNLRITCSRNEETLDSLSEVDKLRQNVAELTEQKDQLQDKIKMVSGENQELWKKLGKLVNVNKNLGDQLNKINETVNQHTAPLQNHTTLIRSKTFTQDEPHTKFLQKNLELNEKISLELENVSLKLTDSFSKQKLEFEKLCSEIADIKSNDIVISENFGFCFDDKLENDLYEDFKDVLEDLKMARTEVIHQKEILQKNIRNVEYLKKKGSPKCKTCDVKKNCQVDRCTSTTDIPKLGVDKFTEMQSSINEDKLKSLNQTLPQEAAKICPMCSRVFRKDVEFSEFQQHVEDHFTMDVSSFEVL